MNLAPIVLFAYKRTKELQITVESLIKCPEAKDSDLYVFCDGPKYEGDRHKVDSARAYIDSIAKGVYFKSVTVTKSDTNKGLASSVISGVSEVLSQHVSAVVLEDDLLLAPSFLSFMNRALHFYESDSMIGSVTGHGFPIDLDIKEDTSLSLRFSSWAWGTWKDRWQDVDWEMSYYDSFMVDRKQIAMLNQAGADMASMLRAQHDGLIDSWAIRLAYWLIRKGQFTVFPVQTLVINIGFAKDSTHCKEPILGYEKLRMCARQLKLSNVKPDVKILNKLKSYYLRRSPALSVLNEYEVGVEDALIIYGTANWAHTVYLELQGSCYNVICFSDSNSERWGSMFYELEIIPPTQIQEKDCDYILIASSAYEEIRQSLLNSNIDAEKIIVFEYM